MGDAGHHITMCSVRNSKIYGKVIIKGEFDEVKVQPFPVNRKWTGKEKESELIHRALEQTADAREVI